ncbi:AAA ATPase midasin [Coemansia javaensis]|uniref:Midasin n=1 Tax=Coemansia javaensis TaxID=2761396 RepID=A0A9W8LHA2_9FUNG|nr:AAA ATPase midasin [Coemansia javaensis]
MTQTAADLVEDGLERLELATQHQQSGEAHASDSEMDADERGGGVCKGEDDSIVDVDPLSVDLPAAVRQLVALAERIEAPDEARRIVEQLAQWAGDPDGDGAGAVLDRVSALLLAEGLGQRAIEPLRAERGPAEWTDGRLTMAVATVFRPLLVDLAARWAQPAAAAVRHLGPHVSAARARLCVAYAAGCLLPTAPQIRSLVADYFGSDEPAVAVEAGAGADETAHRLVVMWRLLRLMPEAARGAEAALALLMGPGAGDGLVRLLACECLCLARGESDRGRAQLTATLGLSADTVARARAWLVGGEQRFAEAAAAQMARQNRAALAQGVWQAVPSGRREWVDEAALSRGVACVGGVLLHAHEAAEPGTEPEPGPGTEPEPEAELVVTATVARNVRAMALAASRGEPVLLQGAAGSGKTSLVEWVARRTGNRLVAVHVSGSMDAKVLLGSYVTTQQAGAFEWRAGLLATAVAEGQWMLIENIDLAPADVIQTLQPLVESQTLFVASRGEAIRAHARFRLFATLSTAARGGSAPRRSTAAAAAAATAATAGGLLGSSTWTRLEIGPLDGDYPQIIGGVFPGLAADADALARAFRSEAVDVLAMREADYERWCAAVRRIGAVFGVAAQRADQFIAQHSPAVAAAGRTLRIGRAALPMGDGGGGGSSSSSGPPGAAPFADTRHARCLLERVAAAVQRSEPVLLVGETGTGKTAAVQRLAALAGRSLAVFNLSQQSDASDLLGGFRPVDVGRVARQLRETFDALFGRTLSVRKNAGFLERARTAFGRRDWKRLAALYRAAAGNARQMIAAAREAGPAICGGGGGGADQITGAPRAKRPRLAAGGADVDALEAEWDAFSERVAAFDAARGARIAFHFAEGALVRAARTGGWILLDEVNLAAAETLACLGGVLQRDRALLLAETGARVRCHAAFRLFACMNPANDVGKRDLPPGLRSGFAEIFVHAPDGAADDLLAIVRAHLPATAPAALCHRVIAFYRAAKALAAEHRLVDGAGQRPHYSLRTLTRALAYARRQAAAYSLPRALYDGLAMAFATQLDPATQAVLRPELHAVFAGADVAQMLRHVPPAPKAGGPAVLVQGFWLPVLDAEAAERAGDDAAAAAAAFVVTASVEAKLQALARAAMCGRHPVLIQGPTSAGKTSMVHHLARRTGHRLVRINNHEHTDLQEYLGAYASASDGQLEFREGLLVQALRHGHWLVLDELNLAPSDVLEALNRLLDDNRELLVPETQEVVRPHPHFMLFATQNPAGLYGGRKALSRAFRSRFVELHFDDIPEPELQHIIVDSCRVPPSHARLLVGAYRALTQARAHARIFEARHGLVTLRDLFRWAGRRAASRDELAEHGFMLLAERTRTAADKQAVRRAIERVFYGEADDGAGAGAGAAAAHSRVRRAIDVDALYSEERLRAMPEFQRLAELGAAAADVAWTRAMRRLFVLAALCLRFDEPVLLVGETGCGKTTVCQLLAAARGSALHTVNCHRNTEAADILGGQRPVRAGDDSNGAALFAWHDGPLVQAMRAGAVFLMDELNLADDSVLERLNSVLEPARTLVLAEHAGEAVVGAAGFAFAATMNPGGDYGKRELSPALRNRFTELWAPEAGDGDGDVDDLRLILGCRLRPAGVPDAERWADAMLRFVAWLRDDLRALPRPLSLRDYLFWAGFVGGTHARLGVAPAVVHGACLALLDAVGAQGSALAIGLRSADAVRAECVARVRALAGWLEPALGVEPARTLAESVRAAAVVAADRDHAGHVAIGPFLVPAGPLGAGSSSSDSGAGPLALDAPTTLDNAVRVARAMQVGRPLLLEGSPGVGKTALVGALARLAGQRLVRINLSDQTDLADLFGTDLPAGDGFAWRAAPFLEALQRGDWVLLDEINLAPQSVLEGLNSCLDHRGTAYIAELDREFAVAAGFRVFAAQNPLAQGGGRKGLPRSFVNRFTQVHVAELRRDDLQAICARAFAHCAPAAATARVLEFNRRMHDATMGARTREFGAAGAPWEFNLRDVTRLMELVGRAAGGSLGAAVDGAVRLLYEQRMRTPRDRQHVRALFGAVFGRALAAGAPTVQASDAWLQIGDAGLPRHGGGGGSATAAPPRVRCLRARLPALEALARCVEMRWMAILVGAAGCGKTALVRWLAAATGNRLVEVALTAGTDTGEILGGFEQVDAQRHCARVLRQARAAAARLAAGAALSPEAAARAARALALCAQAERCGDDVRRAGALAADVAREADDAALAAGAAALARLQSAGRFEWVDGVLVEALERGHWLLLDRANLCSAAVLDRLNGLLEPGGVLHVGEDPGRAGPVVPHPRFRIFMAVDPRHGELSRAMRNRGVEICVLPAEDPGVEAEAAAAVARAVAGAAGAGCPGQARSLADAAHQAALAAERIQRGAAAAAEEPPVEMTPSLEPPARDVVEAVGVWQARLISGSGDREAPLLAALAAVAPGPAAPGAAVLRALVDAGSLGARLLTHPALDAAIGRARDAAARAAGLDGEAAAAAPALAALGGAAARALAQDAWHAALMAALRFWRERAAAEHWRPGGRDARDAVLRRPGADAQRAQACFGVADGCAQLVAAWEAAAADAAAASGALAVLGGVRAAHRMQARLQRLLAAGDAPPSDEAVALAAIAAAARDVAAAAAAPAAVAARAAALAAAAAPLAADASRSARVWARCHPATLSDARARRLEARLERALAAALPPETRASAVEALALLYAAARRPSADRIVEAVARFVDALPADEHGPPADPADPAEPAPADVLAAVAGLAAWRDVLRAAAAVAVGGASPAATAELRALVARAGPQWPVLRTRLAWAAHEEPGPLLLLPLLGEAAFAWCGGVADGPPHALGRAVATELAWRGAQALHGCALAAHPRAVAESRALCRALATFRPPAGSAATDAALSAALRAAAAAAEDGDGADSGHSIIHADDDEAACVALAEAAVALLEASVPARPVDPAAAAHTRRAWLGEDAAAARADAAAHDAVQRAMAGVADGSAAAPFLRAAAELEQQRARIAHVHRPADARFADLWRDAHALAAQLGPRVRAVCAGLRAATAAAALATACGAEQALAATLAQFEQRARARHFGGLRDAAQLWCLCARLVGGALARLAELSRRRCVAAGDVGAAELAAELYAQPALPGAALAAAPATARMVQALDRLKVAAYAGGDPAHAYGALLAALLGRVVLGVQVRGALGPAELAALDAVLRDAHATHRRAEAERRRAAAEAASLFRHRGAAASAKDDDDALLREVFPAYDDVLGDAAAADEGPADPAAAPGFHDVVPDAVAAIAACHRYVALHFGALVPRADVRPALVAGAPRRALLLAAALARAQPALPTLLPRGADGALRGANMVSAALATATPAAASPWAGAGAEHVYDFYHDPAPHEAVLVRPVADAVAARAQALLAEWPDHAVLQRIAAMARRLAQLPVAAPLAQLLAAVEQLHAQAQDWEAYASRDVSMAAQLHDAARLIVRWRQAELAAWPHLLRAQELQAARRADEWWFGLYASLAGAAPAALADLVAAVDHFMQGSPAGEFRARLNLLCAFAAHRRALLAAQAQAQDDAGGSGCCGAPDSVLGPLVNAIGYYAQYAPCIARHLDAAKAAIAKDLAQYVRISSWTDVNPAALRASAQKTHRHLARCVRRWREALAQPIFQIVEAARQAAIASARVPRAPVVPLPLPDAGLEVPPPRRISEAAAALPWAAPGLAVDPAAALAAARLASSAGVPRVLEASAAAMARLARLMADSPVFGPQAAPLAGVLESFAESIVGDVAHFQAMETPRHLVKPAAAAAATPATEPRPKKHLAKSRAARKAEAEAPAPAFVEDAEERQRLARRFWGEQRNLRRARMKEILRALQDIGLKRRRAADDAAAAAGAGLVGLAAAMGRRPLDVAAWHDALATAARASPCAVHRDSHAAADAWRLADAAFFQFAAQMAQLRSAAHEDHSPELNTQQAAAVVALMESLARHVAADRDAAAGLLDAAAAWTMASTPWAALPPAAADDADDDDDGSTAERVEIEPLRRAADGLVVLLEQFFSAARTVTEADGWGDSAPLVARAVASLEQAAPRVAHAHAMLATADAARIAAHVAGVASADAATLLAEAPVARNAVCEMRAAAAALAAALQPAAEAGLDRGLLEPWLRPIHDALGQAQAQLEASDGNGGIMDAPSQAADLAGRWVTAVMNAWQAVHAAEQQFSAALSADTNAWGLAPKELLHRTALAQQLVLALRLPVMHALCRQLTRAVAASGLLRAPQWRALATRVVRPWVVQYSLMVQHVVALYARFHRSLSQFALTTATCLTSVLVHGLGSTEDGEPETERGADAMQSGMGVGEGSTAGAKNVSDEIEGEDQVEGLRGDQPEDPNDANEPATNEDAIDMSNDFDGALGDADLESDDDDSDKDTEDEDQEQDLDEQMGDVDPTDPTSLDDKLWDDEKDDPARDEKKEDSKVDSKAQSKKKDETDIVAADDEDNAAKDGSKDPDATKDGDEDMSGSDDSGDDDDDDEEDGDGSDLDGRVNQDTLDRMADADDAGEQLEMPDDLDMGGEEGDEADESMSEDDGIDADMGELSDDEPIEQKPSAMDEDEAEPGKDNAEERAADDNDDQDAPGKDDAVDAQDADEGLGAESGGEDEAGGSDADSDTAGSEPGEEDEDNERQAMGEDAPEEAKEHSGAHKPTHGVDSAMNMDGTEDLAPDTAAEESQDAVQKPSDAPDAGTKQLPSQGAAAQDPSVQQQPQPQDQPQPDDAGPEPAPERTLADVIEKWERRLNIAMHDADTEQPERQPEPAKEDDRAQDDEAQPAATEFEHVAQDEAFDKVALADAEDHHQPMDLDAEDAQQQQQQQQQEQQEQPQKQDDGDRPTEQRAPAPNPQQHLPPGDGADMASAAQMLQAKGDPDAMDLGSDDGEAGADQTGPGGEHAQDPAGDKAEPEPEPDAVDVEQLREELEQATAAWRADQQDSGRALELWQAYTQLTHELSLMLTEQLRLILTPTQATQLRGDYRTGKRLNMKRIIPYIASEFRKDKIWLRRTKPARREYQVMVALDNSKSMAQTPQAVELAYETLALVTTALTQLEVGQLSVVSFGERVGLLHPFDAPFDAEAGAHVLSRFTFADDRTDVVQLMDASLRLFEAAGAGATNEDLWRLQLVISDGVCQDHPRLLRQVRAATDQRVMTVFIVLDRSALGPAAGDADKDSIMNTQHVSFVTGPDGRMEMRVERYLDTFPFQYYVVLRDIHGLPAVLAETLRQYFSLMG